MGLIVQVAAAVLLVGFLLAVLRWFRRNRAPIKAADPDVPEKGQEDELGKLDTIEKLAAAIRLLHATGSANFQSFARHLRRELDAHEARQESFRRLFTVGYVILAVALLGGLYAQHRADSRDATNRAESRDRFAVVVIENCLKIERGNARIRASLMASLKRLLTNPPSYYRTHPKEYAEAIRQLRQEIARFKPEPCIDPRTGKVVKKKSKLRPPG